MDKKILKFIQNGQLRSDEAKAYLNGLTDLRLSPPLFDGKNFRFYLNRTPNLKKLYLNSTKFTEFPDGMHKLEQLEKFTFDMSVLPGQDFTKLFAIMPNIKEIAFRRFELKQLPNDLPKLEQMQYLDLSSMTASGKALKKLLAIMPNLKQLSLGCENFSPLPDGLARLEHLEKLELTEPITSEDFKKLMDIMPNLKEIVGLEIIPPITEGSRYDNIETIQISGPVTGDNFKKLMAIMPKLKTINGNEDYFLGSMPENMPKLGYLESFQINSSTITGEDLKSFAEIAPNLKNLEISCENLGEIPDNFPVLPHVEDLYLAGSMITGDNFKTLMAKLPRVTKLFLARCLSASQIPDDISNLNHVEKLYISVNSLDDNNFKKLLGMMPNLKLIYFFDTQVPAGLPSLEHVQVIHLQESLNGVNFRRIISKTNPVKIKEIGLAACEFSDMDLKIGEFNFPQLRKLDLTDTNIKLHELLVFIIATSESKLVDIDIDQDSLVDMLQGASLWAKAILVGAFPHRLLKEFTTNPQYQSDYKTLLASKLIGTYEDQNLLIENHHPRQTDSDYILYEQNKEFFEPVAATYWKKFTGTLPMTPYKVVMEALNAEGALVELLNSKKFVIGDLEKIAASKKFVIGDLEKIAAYDMFAQLYFHQTLKTIKKVGKDRAMEYTRRNKDDLYLQAKEINALLRQEECYEKLEKCQNILELFETLFNDLFERTFPKPGSSKATNDTTTRKKPNMGV